MCPTHIYIYDLKLYIIIDNCSYLRLSFGKYQHFFYENHKKQKILQIYFYTIAEYILNLLINDNENLKENPYELFKTITSPNNREFLENELFSIQNELVLINPHLM